MALSGTFSAIWGHLVNVGTLGECGDLGRTTWGMGNSERNSGVKAGYARCKCLGDGGFGVWSWTNDVDAVRSVLRASCRRGDVREHRNLITFLDVGMVGFP